MAMAKAEIAPDPAGCVAAMVGGADVHRDQIGTEELSSGPLVADETADVVKAAVVAEGSADHQFAAVYLIDKAEVRDPAADG